MLLSLFFFLHLSIICSAHPASQHLLKKPVSLRSEIEECRKEGRYYTLPDCVDHDAGYGCECGPGYKWNSAVCVATSVDSRLDFLGELAEYLRVVPKTN